MDAQGIEYLHQIEMDLTPNGMLGWNDGILKVVTRETVTFHSPIGSEMTKTCVGRIGFAPIPDDSTAIRAALDVSLVGGQWVYRRKIRTVDERTTTALFRDSINQCHNALDTVGDQTID